MSDIPCKSDVSFSFNASKRYFIPIICNLSVSMLHFPWLVIWLYPKRIKFSIFSVFYSEFQDDKTNTKGKYNLRLSRFKTKSFSIATKILLLNFILMTFFRAHCWYIIEYINSWLDKISDYSSIVDKKVVKHLKYSLQNGEITQAKFNNSYLKYKNQIIVIL